MVELKPCPFCGKEARIRTVKIERIRTDYIAQCTDSSCLGRSVKKFPSKEKAAAAWNRRADNG